MNELIRVTYDSEQRPTVTGRDLHEALGIDTPYFKWFLRMCEYGFEEYRDFRSFLSKSTDGRPSTMVLRKGETLSHF
ncbi:MAG: antA/AntB antirepressor family protein [Oscillospiraceae bacterium]|nr:antA/AntB antirepressor family protein [Oscillospiraceae bacterium]